MRIDLIVIFILFFALSCRCKKEAVNSISPIEKTVQNYAQELYGSAYLISFNQDSTYVVVYTFLKNRPSDVSPTLSYQLLEAYSLDIVFKDLVPRADFQWVDTYTIEIKAEKGIASSEEESVRPMIYRYHVKNRKKYIPGGFGNKKQ